MSTDIDLTIKGNHMEEPASRPFLSGLRNNITVIELIELSILSVAFWYFLVMLDRKETDPGPLQQLDLLNGLVIIVLGSWLIYNVYIFLARIGGRKVDVIIWIIASLVTATYTFWAWSVLDINRWIMARLFYRGEAPVEYAWSTRSKLVRKVWQETRSVPVKPHVG